MMSVLVWLVGGVALGFGGTGLSLWRKASSRSVEGDANPFSQGLVAYAFLVLAVWLGALWLVLFIVEFSGK